MERMQEGFGERNEVESAAIRVSSYTKKSSGHDSIVSSLSASDIDIDLATSMSFPSAAGEG